MTTSSGTDRIVVALDVDGVLLDASRGQRWLDVVAAEFELTASDFDPWFGAHWAEVVTGKRGIEAALGEFIPAIDVERFLARWFEESSAINDEIVVAAQQWQAAGATLVLATNQEHRRAAHLREHLAAHLDLVDVLYSADLGVGKPSAQFFGAADKRLGPCRVVFIDDVLANVEAARAHGWTAIHYPAESNWRETVDSYFK